MLYNSTRDGKNKISAAEAIATGLARDGGLFVPDTIPALSPEDIKELCNMDYRHRAVKVMSMFLEDFTVSELESFAEKAYGLNYDSPDIAPVKTLDGNTYCLELWHGPTCAFKDMALQMLPHLFTASLKKTGEKRRVCILVATSGDTGKAALEGFADVEGTKIFVFFPKDGVSDIQQMQMTTQKGGNVGVCSVVGNFDDVQTGVKIIFSDEKIREELAENGWFLSSANSINWGRLLPQIVYYISAYCDLVKAGRINLGDEINYCVPTGNFGNILAGYYAKRMGLPVKKLICASNSNDVLTEFINTGVYNRNRRFYTTVSPSMDILVSSNLERLLYELSGKDAELIKQFMAELGDAGKYQVSGDILTAVQSLFSGGSCSEEETKSTVGMVFKKYDYLIDTHTAVAFKILEDYRHTTGDETTCVVVSTASPYKFSQAVLSALGGDTDGLDGFGYIDALNRISGVKIPRPLDELREKAVRFTDTIEKSRMAEKVKSFTAE